MSAGNITWQQRYWVNSQWFTPGGPCFVYIGGEGPGSPYDVMEGEHVDFAVQYGALVVSIEHRYYGASQPVPDVSTRNLQWLSSHQAIADVATLLAESIIPTFNLTGPDAKVITFGGSYPGVLSAWIRLRLPHLVHAAFSTSSPVTSAVDYQGYNNVVGFAFSDPVVGGSQQCYNVLSGAFAAMATGLSGSTEARHSMAALMSSCTGLDGTNDTSFAIDEFSNVIKGIVQGNDAYPDMRFDVRNICSKLTSFNGAAVDAFATWFRDQYLPSLNPPEQCYYLSYQGMVQWVTNTSIQGTGWYRQWYWETCSQFGLSQTCDAGTLCPFSQLSPDTASNLQTCVDAFGYPMSASVTVDRVAFTNAYMGGQSLRPTRVLYINGDVDPWHAASVLAPAPDSDIYSILINGTSHCRNMLPPRPDDPPSLVKARVDIAAVMAHFMSVPK